MSNPYLYNNLADGLLQGYKLYQDQIKSERDAEEATYQRGRQIKQDKQSELEFGLKSRKASQDFDLGTKDLEIKGSEAVTAGLQAGTERIKADEYSTPEAAKQRKQKLANETELVRLQGETQKSTALSARANAAESYENVAASKEERTDNKTFRESLTALNSVPSLARTAKPFLDPANDELTAKVLEVGNAAKEKRTPAANLTRDELGQALYNAIGDELSSKIRNKPVPNERLSTLAQYGVKPGAIIQGVSRVTDSRVFKNGKGDEDDEIGVNLMVQVKNPDGSVVEYPSAMTDGRSLGVKATMKVLKLSELYDRYEQGVTAAQVFRKGGVAPEDMDKAVEILGKRALLMNPKASAKELIELIRDEDDDNTTARAKIRDGISALYKEFATGESERAMTPELAADLEAQAKEWGFPAMNFQQFLKDPATTGGLSYEAGAAAPKSGTLSGGVTFERID